jgi:phosphatidate phosphatase APP1
MTPSPIGILRTTFIDDPTPIPGMPKLYQHIATTLSPTWFYLSASPYNLYPFLRPFLHTHYPKGTLILRDASWQDLSGFLESLIQGTAAYKESRMDKIHTWLPNRKILCVGDSTQSDPEAYGAIYRKYKGWIRAIFIRKVTDVAEMNATEKNSDARFEAAFEGVPRSVWTIFDDPKDLTQAVEALTTI